MLGLRLRSASNPVRLLPHGTQRSLRGRSARSCRGLVLSCPDLPCPLNLHRLVRKHRPAAGRPNNNPSPGGRLQSPTHTHLPSLPSNNHANKPTKTSPSPSKPTLSRYDAGRAQASKQASKRPTPAPYAFSLARLARRAPCHYSTTDSNSIPALNSRHGQPANPAA